MSRLGVRGAFQSVGDLSCHLPSWGLSFLRVKSWAWILVSEVLKAMKGNYFLCLSRFDECLGGPLAGTEARRPGAGMNVIPLCTHQQALLPQALLRLSHPFSASWCLGQSVVLPRASGFTVLCFWVQGPC